MSLEEYLEAWGLCARGESPASNLPPLKCSLSFSQVEVGAGGHRADTVLSTHLLLPSGLGGCSWDSPFPTNSVTSQCGSGLGERGKANLVNGFAFSLPGEPSLGEELPTASNLEHQSPTSGFGTKAPVHDKVSLCLVLFSSLGKQPLQDLPSSRD